MRTTCIIAEQSSAEKVNCIAQRREPSSSTLEIIIIKRSEGMD